MAYTGFIGIDSEALGDGDDDTQVLDAWLVQRVQYNIERASDGYHSLCFSPVISNASDFTTFAGIRPYAQSERGTFWKGYAVVNKGQAGIRVSLAYQSEAPGKGGTASGETLVWIELEDGSSLEQQPLGSSYDTGTQTAYAELDFYFNSPATKSYIAEIKLFVNAHIDTLQGTTHGASADGSSTTLSEKAVYLCNDSAKTGTLYWSPNAAAPGPTSNSFEAMVFRSTDTGSAFPNTSTDRLNLLDIMHTQVNTGTSGAGTYALMAQAVPESSTGETKVSQCFFLRAMSFRPLFPRGVRNIPFQRLQPHQEVGATEHLQQAEYVRELLTDWRVALMGPRGKKNSADANMDPETNYGYAVHWPFVHASYDGTTAGQEHTLVNDSFYLNTPNPDLELRCWWACVQIGDYTDWSMGNPDFGISVWDVAITIDQIDFKASGGATWAANATEVASGTFPERMMTWASNVTAGIGSPPLLRGAGAATQAGKSITGSAAPFWYKEGTLFTDLGDERPGYLLLTETRHDFSATASSSQIARPLRLNIEASLNSYPKPLSDNYLSDAARNTMCRLMLVGFVLVEKPNL